MVGSIEFNVAISPPRFELNAESGQVLRETVGLSNLGDTPAEFLVRTADWSLGQGGGLNIHGEELQPGSCRPWTRIERKRVAVAPNRERQYRFEVHLPEDTDSGECRFAILFQQPAESADRMTMGNVSVPVLGQVAVIVYVTVGDASPELHVKEVVRTGAQNDEVALVMQNTGDAHGRPEGIVTIRGPGGERREYLVGPVAILPGMTRQVPLWPGDGSKAARIPAFPVTVTGDVEWQGGSHELDATIE